MTLKAALYARYSTDKQRETSIEDQLRAARARAEREGWAIVATYTDEEVSGSTPVALRPGGKALMAGILAMRFEVLIVEGLDRLSREIGEQESLVKHWLSTAEAGPVVRELQALGEVSVGMCSCWEFVPL